MADVKFLIKEKLIGCGHGFDFCILKWTLKIEIGWIVDLTLDVIRFFILKAKNLG